MNFLVPNYICLQNPGLGGYRPQIPFFYVLCPQLNLLNPHRTKFLGTPLLRRTSRNKRQSEYPLCWPRFKPTMKH